MSEQEYELIVADDGIGIPPHVDLEAPQSLGMDLVNTFVLQLKGEITIEREHGTKATVRFGRLSNNCTCTWGEKGNSVSNCMSTRKLKSPTCIRDDAVNSVEQEWKRCCCGKNHWETFPRAEVMRWNQPYRERGI